MACSCTNVIKIMDCYFSKHAAVVCDEVLQSSMNDVAAVDCIPLAIHTWIFGAAACCHWVVVVFI